MSEKIWAFLHKKINQRLTTPNTNCVNLGWERQLLHFHDWRPLFKSSFHMRTNFVRINSLAASRREMHLLGLCLILQVEREVFLISPRLLSRSPELVPPLPGKKRKFHFPARDDLRCSGKSSTSTWTSHWCDKAGRWETR